MTTIIEHPEYGRVEGVKRADGQGGAYPVAAWGKNGAVYFVTHGWKEVTQVVDVTEQVKVYEEDGVSCIEIKGYTRYLPGLLKWNKTKAVVLPEDCFNAWNGDGREFYTIEGAIRHFISWLKQSEQSVLTIKKEGEG